jgi:hypothetical protein
VPMTSYVLSLLTKAFKYKYLSWLHDVHLVDIFT